ncbi:hypothetical protein AtDm6_3301 [Acetobacter tropicalis]|nr:MULTISPECIES: hypothetical protein [Acetobacter]KGB20936.1 hypothetical protein AtDm6_3301 [Acetobacter tropicalis]
MTKHIEKRLCPKPGEGTVTVRMAYAKRGADASRFRASEPHV